MASAWADGSDEVEQCREWIRSWCGEEPTELRGDGRLVVTRVAGPVLDRLSLDAEHFIGRPMQYVGECLGQQVGGHLAPIDPVSGFANEVALAAGVGDDRVELRNFLFVDGADLVALVGVRSVADS